MVDDSFFLRSNSLGDLASAAGPDGGLYDNFESQRSFLSNRCGSDAAALFAEPVVTQDKSTGISTVSWYSIYEGEPLRLVDQDPDARAAAEGILQERLQALDPAMRDPERGLGVSQSLYLPSMDDVYVINGQPVLTNWGMAPADALSSEDSRTAHFGNTLGSFMPGLARPAVTAEEWSAFLAQEPLAAASEAGPQAEAATEATAATAAVPQGGAAVPPVGGVPPLPPQRVAWYRRPSLPLIGAVVIAALVLIYLLLPGVLIYPEKAVANVSDPATNPEVRKKTNDALRDRLAALRKAHEKNVCTADGDLILPSGETPRGLVPGEGGTTPIPSKTLVPPDAADLKVPPAAPGAKGLDGKSVLNLLDNTTALVVRTAKKSLGTGSGFFVGPNLLVTNAHVVGKSPGQSKFFVANRALGKPVPAKVVHVSTAKKEDFAVLQIEGAAEQPYLALGTTVGRLDNVVAAGYPGILLSSDLNWHRMIKGDASAIPQMAVTQGVVTVLQNMPGGREVIAHTATISPGNSGGPLVDSCGRVVGINTFGRTQKTRTVYYAIQSGSLAAFLQSKGVDHSKVGDACQPTIARAPAPVGEPPASGVSGDGAPKSPAAPGASPPAAPPVKK